MADNNSSMVLPYGTIISFCGTTTPENWLECNGQAVSRTTYSNLFSVIGTTYGSGNGSTTFNLPNLNGRFVQGTLPTDSSFKTLESAGIPNISGTFASTRYDPRYNGSITGKFITVAGSSGYSSSHTGSDKTYRYSYDAGRVSSVYRDVTTVQPPAIKYRFIIKAK